MYASTGASEVDHTECSARPRPFCSRRTTRTSASSVASRLSDSGSVIDAGVVRDRDASRKGELVPQMAVQPIHRIRQRGLFVVNRDHHIEDRHTCGQSRDGRVGPWFEADSSTRAGVGFEGDVGHDING